MADADFSLEQLELRTPSKIVLYPFPVNYSISAVLLTVTDGVYILNILFLGQYIQQAGTILVLKG
jgi:hypothetical protein